MWEISKMVFKYTMAAIISIYFFKTVIKIRKKSAKKTANVITFAFVLMYLICVAAAVFYEHAMINFNRGLFFFVYGVVVTFIGAWIMSYMSKYDPMVKYCRNFKAPEWMHQKRCCFNCDYYKKDNGVKDGFCAYKEENIPK